MDAVVYDKIGKEAEKVREVLYGIYPQETITGADIASFDDGADDIPVKALTVGIEPVQDLHGYDHPWPAGGGKNLLECCKTAQTIQGVSFTPNLDAGGNVVSLTVNGTNTGGVILYDVASSFQAESGQYILSGAASGSSSDTYQLDVREGSVVISGGTDAGNSPRITLDGSKTYRVCVRVAASATVSNAIFKPMIRLATEADSTFEPYSNICPISGWTEAKVTRTGKNLYDYATSNVSSGGTFSLITNGFRFTGNRAYQSTKGMFNDFIGGQTYKLSAHIKANVVDENYRPRIAIRSNTNAIIAQVSLGGSGAGEGDLLLTYTPQTNITAYISVIGTGGSPSATVDIECTNIQLELGSTATAYEPYQGETYDITFPSSAGTVYGGTLDVTNGKLVVDRKSVVYNGTESWGWSTYSSRPYVNNASNGMKQYSELSCSHYRYTSGTAATNKTVTTNAGSGSTLGYGVWFMDSVNAESIDAWKQYLAAQNTAGTPVTVIYELATPIEFTMTPQEIATLLGVNSIWADTGAVKKLDYRADLGKYITDKITEMSANILNA